MKVKKGLPSSKPLEPPTWIRRYWGWAASAFTVYSFWAFLKYEGDFFPFNSEAIYQALSWDGAAFPHLDLLWLYGRSLALFLMLLMIAAWLGWKALPFLQFETDVSPLAQGLLCEGLGLAGLSLISVGLGFAHLYYRDLFWGLYGLGALRVMIDSLKSQRWKDFWRAAREELSKSWRMAGLGFFKIAVLLLLFFNLVIDFVPEVSYDSLFYHLALPHLYLLEHKIVNLPYMNFSKFPQGFELLFTWGLVLQGDIVAKLLHGIMGPLSFVALLILCQKMKQLHAWPIAGALVLTIPVVSICLWNTSVDIGLLFYSLLALYAMMRWLETEGRRWPWVVLTGIFAGMAASIKYMGGSVLIGVLGTVLWDSWRQKKLGRTFKELMGCGAIGLLWVSPWFIRNYVDTGNPVYPLLYKIFKGPLLWPEHMDSFMGAVKGYIPNGLWGWIRIPWALTVGEPKGPENTCWLGPTLWVLLPALLFLPRRNRWLSVLGMYTLFNFMAEAASTNQARYLLQGYAGLGLLLAVGFLQLYDQGWKGVRVLLLIPLMGAVVLNLQAALMVAHTGYSPQDVLTGNISRHDYVSVYHPGMNPNPVTSLYLFMKNHPPPEPRRVVFVAEEKTYGCPWPFVYGNVYDRTPLLEWNRQQAAPEALYAYLLKENIGYILYNDSEGHRLASYGLFYGSPEEKARLNLFWNAHVRPVYAERGIYLFAILPAEEAAARPLLPCPFLALGPSQGGN